jgi:hypothetical protein
VSAKLPKSWPETVQRIVLDAARWYYQQVNEPFAVPDAVMDEAIEYAVREIEANQRYIYEEASTRWINRWESGQFEADMRKAIGEMHGRLRRAERGLRPRAAGATKKRASQLDAEIAQALGSRRS